MELKNSELLKSLDGAVYNAISSNLPLTFFASSIVIVILFFIIVNFINNKVSPGNSLFAGLVVGKDNRLSISKFQGVLWTLITIISFMTLKMINEYCQVSFDTKIPPNLLSLIGLNFTTLVLAKGITSHSTSKGNIKTVSTTSSMSDLYRTDDDTKTDLMKFQMLCWTVVAVVVYFVNFFSQFRGEVISVGFPNIDNTLLYLMLIGQSAYLGDKMVNSNKVKITGTIPLVVRVGEPFSIHGNFVQDETTFTMNKRITMEVLDWSAAANGLTRANVLIPEGKKLNATPAEIIATTQGIMSEPYFVDVDL